MTNKKVSLDQKQGRFDFEAAVENYQAAREEVLNACQAKPARRAMTSPAEACIEIAAAIKRALRETQMSREQLVDAVNDYFGLDVEQDEEEGQERKRLTIHMLNNYLSKPSRYPIPTYYISALTEITGSLEILQVLAAASGAQVIGAAEVRQMNLGKLDEMISEMQRLKRQMKAQ